MIANSGVRIPEPERRPKSEDRTCLPRPLEKGIVSTLSPEVFSDWPSDFARLSDFELQILGECKVAAACRHHRPPAAVPS